MAAATVFGIPASALVGKAVGWPAVFGGLGMLAAVVVLLMQYTLPRLPPRESPSIASHLELLKRPTFLVHLGLSVLTFVGMFAGYSYLGVVFHDLVGLEGWTLSAALLGFGLAGLFGNWIAAQIVDRDPLKASGVNIVIVGATMALTFFAHGGALQFGAAVLWGVGHMASFVFNQVRMLAAGRSAPTFAAALHISVCNLGIALGASFGSSLATKFGVRFAGLGGAAIALAAAAIAFALVNTRVRRSTGAASNDNASRSLAIFQRHV
jgi:predicted MFS family arabinose efflux permease